MRNFSFTPLGVSKGKKGGISTTMDFVVVFCSSFCRSDCGLIIIVNLLFCPGRD